MTVKRYTPLQCLEHAGTYVTYSDYQKLAAENAALKLIINEVGDLSLSPHIQKLCEVETPDTDAFTAELRAQGVDEQVSQLEAEYGEIDDVCAMVFRDLRECAADLRAGRKG